MGSMGLERSFAVVIGSVLVLLGVAGSLGNPIVGGPEQTNIIVTGFGHDLVHLVTGALFLHVGLALNGRNQAYGLVGLGVFYVVTGLLSFVSADLLGLYDEPTSGLDQIGHVLLGLAAIVIGWMGRGVERRVYGRAVSRPAHD
jgi:prepilin signal peptidase PulO-like enzyme (type II secretory pathway)